MSNTTMIENALHATVASWDHMFERASMRRCAHLVASSATALPMVAQVALAKVAIWMQAVADLVDDPDADIDLITLRLDQYQQLIVRGDCPELVFDPLARLVLTAAGALVAHPELWASCIARMVDVLDELRAELAIARAA